MTGLHTAILALALTGAGTGTDEPVLLDFSATWCGPCRQMDPVINGLIAKGYPVKKLDYDKHRDLARKYGVDQIPCFVMTVDGRETARVLGTVPITATGDDVRRCTKAGPSEGTAGAWWTTAPQHCGLASEDGSDSIAGQASRCRARHGNSSSQ